MPKIPPPFDVRPIVHPSRAISYVVVDPESREAMVVDPLLDRVDETLATLAAAGATLRFVVETHSHGDHLSGAAALKAKTGAEVVMSAAAESRVATTRVSEGDALPLGEQRLRVRAAPGNSPDAIVLVGEGSAGPRVLFTGDTLLVGTVGVRDVPGADATAHYDTIQRVFESLPDDTVIHPGHDDMGRTATTIKAEKRGNRWMREKDRDAFLARFAADPRAVPKEAEEILRANREGADTPPLAALEAAGKIEKADHSTGARTQVVVPPGMGQSPPAGPVAEGISHLILLAGVVAVLGTALGFLVHSGFHLLSGLAGIAGVGLGLAGMRRRAKKKDMTGLYYLGPLPRSPQR